MNIIIFLSTYLAYLYIFWPYIYLLVNLNISNYSHSEILGLYITSICGMCLLSGIRTNNKKYICIYIFYNIVTCYPNLSLIQLLLVILFTLPPFILVLL